MKVERQSPSSPHQGQAIERGFSERRKKREKNFWGAHTTSLNGLGSISDGSRIVIGLVFFLYSIHIPIAALPGGRQVEVKLDDRVKATPQVQAFFQTGGRRLRGPRHISLAP